MSTIFDAQPAPVSKQGMFSMDEVILSDRKKKKDALRIAQMRSANTGVAMEQSFREAMGEIESGIDVQALQQKEQSAYAAIVSSDLTEYVAQNAANPDPNVQASINNIISDFSGVRDSLLDDYDGVEQVFVDQYADESIESFRQRQLAGRYTVNRKVDEIFEENGFLENSGNFVAQLFAPDDIKDMNDLAGSLGTDIPGLMDLMADFQTRDPEEQMVVMEELLPVIVDAFDNNPSAVRGFVDMMYSDDIGFDVGLTAAFDSLALLDVAFVARGVSSLIKLGSRSARNRNSASEFADLDNMEMAGATVARAGSDQTDEVLEAVDANRTDLASTANPARMEDQPILTGQMDDLAAEVQKNFKPITNRIVEDLLPVAGNKLSRGEAKKLATKKHSLEYDIAKLEKQRAAITKKDVRAGTAKRSVMTEKISKLNDQLATVNERIAINTVSAEAYADISRLSQGIIPPRLKPAFDAMMKEELDKIARPMPKQAPNVSPRKEDAVELAANPRFMDAPEEFGLTQEFAEAVKTSVTLPLRAIAEEGQDLSVEALSASQRKVAEDRALERLHKRMEKSGQNINSLEVTGRSEKGFTARYTTDAGVDDTYSYDFTVSDSGSLVADPKLAKSNVPSALRGVLSPEVVWNDMMGQFIKDVTYGGQQTAKLANSLMKKYREIDGVLGKESRIHVDALLEAGDEAGTVFTPRELLDGMIDVRIGEQGIRRKYSKEEVMVYFQKRAFFDELHRFRNELMRDQLSFKGFKNIRYTDANGVARDAMVRTYDDISTAKAQLGEKSFYIPDNEGKGVAKFSDNKFLRDKMIDQGYVPVKLAQPIRNKNGKVMSEWAMVRQDAPKQLPSQVLNYSAGYVPRIYKAGYTFVKNGDSPTQETILAFETRADAQKYADDLRNDPSSEYKNPVVKADREFTDLERMEENAASFGGLYTGARKTRPLMVKTADGLERPERMSVAGATQRYIQSVSNVMPVNTYRMAVVEQWMNTVNDIAKLQGRQGIRKQDGIDGAIDLEPEDLAMMEDARAYIKNVLSIPSDKESHFRNTMMHLGEVMRGKPGGDWVLNNLHGDPVKAMKGLTFNAHLGWFNIRQLWVQAQNASIAVSMHPVQGVKAVAKLPALRMAIHSDNPEVWKEIAKKSGMDVEEFVQDVDMVKKSGMLDAINRVADFDANVAGLGTGTFEGLRKAAAKGRVFYEEGETVSRLLAAQIAKNNLKDAGQAITPQSLSEETLRLHMNLQAENAATWQQNVFGVPTQFMQVFAKFGENIVPGLLGSKNAKWTRSESAKVLAGQVILYGTVGVPFAEGISAYLADEAGTDPVAMQRENPLLLEGIEEGLVGVLFSMAGLENNFSEGSSLLAGMDDNVAVELASALADYMAGNEVDASVFDVGFGASGNTLVRGADAIINLFDAARNMFTHPSMATLGYETLDILDGLASTTSTWNNARKAYYAKVLGEGLRSKRGNVLLTPEELGTNWASDVAKAVGFPYDREGALWRAYEYNIDSADSQRKTTQDLRKIYLEYTRSGNLDLYRKQKAALLSVHNPFVRRDIEKNFNKSTLVGDSAFTLQARKFTLDQLKNGGREPLPLLSGTLLEEENR